MFAQRVLCDEVGEPRCDEAGEPASPRLANGPDPQQDAAWTKTLANERAELSSTSSPAATFPRLGEADAASGLPHAEEPPR